MKHSTSRPNLHYSKTSKTYLYTPLTPTNSLPYIYDKTNPLLNNSSSPSHSNDLNSLKKYLHRLHFEIKELKISQMKLKNEGKEHKHLIQEAITLSKNTSRPINLQELFTDNTKENQTSNTNHTKDDEKSTIPIDHYLKLQQKKNLFAIKKEIIFNQKMLRDRENEINNLKIESKVTHLINKNNSLIQTNNKITLQNEKINEIENYILPSKQSSKEAVLSQVSYNQAINNALKQENTSIKDKYNNMKNQNSKHVKTVNNLEEKCNNLKHKYNINKQIENKKVNELKMLNDKKEVVPLLKESVQQNEQELNSRSEEVSQLKKENENKQTQIDELNNSNMAIQNKIEECMKNIRREHAKEKEEYNKIKNENDAIDKNILLLKNENYDLKEELDKLIIKYNKKLAAEKKDKNEGVKKYNKGISKIHEKEMEFIFMSNVNKDDNEQQQNEEKETSKQEDKTNEQNEPKQE